MVLRLCWFMVYRTRNVWFCACVGLWFIERGMCGFALVLVYGLLNEECVVLRLCWFMVYRTRNITFGVCLSWFLPSCWLMVYRTSGPLQSVRIVRIERTVTHCALM